MQVKLPPAAPRATPPNPTLPHPTPPRAALWAIALRSGSWSLHYGQALGRRLDKECRADFAGWSRLSGIESV
ncbi:MAG: hypothetical protein MUO42_12500 [Anaerolineaceae bacterium]|nr:hypothetical protein [Anaerolineaceae bacterium]